MSGMAEDTLQQNTLKEDADFSSPLRRVAYEAGMLLGLEATRDEQSYHRQRLNRLQYWMLGSGTLVGMVVAIDPPTTTAVGPILTRMTVSPGIGVDGLGREVNIHESYCIDLGEWLQAQTQTSLRNGYDEVNDTLWLNISVRYHACDVAQQPVLARKLNLSTDAVQSSRTADSILLEIMPSVPPEIADERYRPWAVHRPLNETPPTLSADEQADIDNAVGNTALHNQLQLQARLLHALDDRGVDTELAATQLEEGARLLLARVRIDVADLTSILNAEAGDPVVNPNDIHVNNLVRPFLMTAGQLAYIERTA